MKRYIITVTGKVQGVFFRDTARQVATTLGMHGFARNAPDGSVHIEVEGDDAELSQFIAWCEEGPAHATVDNVSYIEEKTVGYSDFAIK